MNKVYKAFKKVRDTEVERFREKSYFSRRVRGLSPTVSNSDPDISEEEEKGVTYRFKEPKVEE